MADLALPPDFEWNEGEQRPVAVFYTARETAEILGVTERTIRRWIEAGKLEAEKRNGGFRIHIEDARAAMAHSRAWPDANRQHLHDRVEWLEAENARLWALLEKVACA